MSFENTIRSIFVLSNKKFKKKKNVYYIIYSKKNRFSFEKVWIEVRNFLLQKSEFK